MTNKEFLRIMRKLPKDAVILGVAYDHRSEIKEITYTVTQDNQKYIILKAEQLELHGATGIDNELVFNIPIIIPSCLF